MANSITPKQLHFCRAVSSGCTLSDAYREAYDAENMKPASIHREASVLMANPMVTQRCETLQRDKERAVVATYVSDRELVLTKLRYFADHAQPQDSMKIRATELLGKSCALFTDVVENKKPRTAAEIHAEIETRLGKYEDDAETDEDAAVH